MKCLETRQTPEGYRRRRYEAASGHRFTTIEVPMELWRRVNGVGRQQDRAAQVRRTLDRESKMRQARALAAHMSQRAVARAMNEPVSTVRHWLKSITRSNNP